MNQTMHAKDTLRGSAAECFITIDGDRYNFMQMIDLEAKFEKEKTSVPILGRTGKGNKSTGWTGTFSGTMHYNTSVMRELMYRFKETGEDIYF